nr:recombinase family protein [Vibrio anguillarum]
ELFLLTDDTTAHEIARQKLNDAKAEKVELLKQKDDGKEFVISAEAIKEFEGYIQRAYEDENDFEARSYVKDILLQCVEKLVIDTEPRSVESLGYKNLYKGAKVWTVTVDFRSGKRITIYHDVDTNMSLFNQVEGGGNSFHTFTPEALEIWDQQGDEAFVKHLSETGYGLNSSYVQDFISSLDDK